MPDYKDMYLKLFRSQTEAIALLQKAQQETEEMYISAEPADIRILPTADKDDTTENNP